MKQYYFAYGSNLNLKQMAIRCPTAKVVGVGKLKGYRLIFSYYATVIRDESSFVPVAIWEIDGYCEAALDRYEGFPTFYRKENITVETADGDIRGIIYIMNKSEKQPPSEAYYNVIIDGCHDTGIGTDHIESAFRDSFE